MRARATMFRSRRILENLSTGEKHESFEIISSEQEEDSRKKISGFVTRDNRFYFGALREPRAADCMEVPFVYGISWDSPSGLLTARYERQGGTPLRGVFLGATAVELEVVKDFENQGVADGFIVDSTLHSSEVSFTHKLGSERRPVALPESYAVHSLDRLVNQHIDLFTEKIISKHIKPIELSI